MVEVEKLKTQVVKLKEELKKIDKQKDLLKYREVKKNIKRLQRRIRQLTGKKLETIRKKKVQKEEATAKAASAQAKK
jgi:FtsZ-binding cell division protein ZapB